LERKIIPGDCLRSKKVDNYFRVDCYRMILISKKTFLTLQQNYDKNDKLGKFNKS